MHKHDIVIFEKKLRYFLYYCTIHFFKSIYLMYLFIVTCTFKLLQITSLSISQAKATGTELRFASRIVFAATKRFN